MDHDLAPHVADGKDDPLPDPARSEGPPVRLIAFVLTWSALWSLPVALLVAPVVPGGWITVGVAFAIAVSPLAVLVRYFGSGVYPPAAVRVWAFRPFWYVQVGLPLLTFAAVAGAGIGAMAAVLGVAPHGTAAGGRVALAVALPALAAFGLWGFVGAHRLVVRHVTLRWPELPHGLDGLRIVQISDLHVGPHSSRRVLRRVVQRVREAEPELIAVTGDQVDDFEGDVAHFAEAFGDLSAPLGVYAVAGNHDIYAGWEGVRAGMRAAGLTVLENAATPLERNGSRFWVAGTGDPAAAAPGMQGPPPDVKRTLAAVPPDAFVVCLAHNPALWPALADRGVALTLSGHTHHGQLSIPRLGWSLASVFLDRAMGMHRSGLSVLYINPGTHYWGIPFRVGALPEVTVVTVARGSPEGEADPS